MEKTVEIDSDFSYKSWAWKNIAGLLFYVTLYNFD